MCLRQSNSGSRSTSKADWDFPNLVTRVFLLESSSMDSRRNTMNTWTVFPSIEAIGLLALPCCTTDLQGQALRGLLLCRHHQAVGKPDRRYSGGQPAKHPLSDLSRQGFRPLSPQLVESLSASWDTAPPIPLTYHPNCTAVVKISVAIN